MTMKSQLRIVLFFLSLVAVTGCRSAANNPLVVTWRLVSLSGTAADGSVAPQLLGPDPNGYLTYTSDGFMHVILTGSSRPLLSGDWASSPADERAAAFATSLAYAGRYSVSDGEVTHHMELSTDPKRAGNDAVRKLTLADGVLTLTTPPLPAGGVSSEFVLTWQRLEP